MLTNLIPYLGPIIGAVPSAIVALLPAAEGAGASVGLTLAPVTVYLIGQLIDVAFVFRPSSPRS